MKLKAFLWTIILSMVFTACSGGDDESGFSISFELKEYAATFYTPGQTEQLKINLDIGEGGDMDVNLTPETHPSIFYNGVTGSIEWTRELPLGANTATIIAMIDSMEASTQITINNTFQGSFEGGYNFTPETNTITSNNFTVQFNAGGTINLYDDGYDGTGTWERSQDNTIQFIYSYDVAPSVFYTFRGPLVYNSNEAYIEGFFYRGNKVVPGEERGYFRIEY